MFDTLLDLFFAFTQVTMLFVALVFLGIGGLLILYPAWQWFSGVRVQGRIVAVRATGTGDVTDPPSEPERRKHIRAREMYYPVFEYRTPQGRSVQAMGDSGSSALADKIPGMPVTVLLRHDDPESPSRPERVMYILGLVFALPALFLLRQALQSLELNVYTVLVAIGLIAYFALKARKHIKPREQWETVAAFRARKKAEKANRGRLLTPEEFRQRLRDKDRQTRRWMPFMALIAVASMAGGAYWWQAQSAFETAAVRTTGEVVRLHQSRDSDGDTTYYPVVAFRAEDGRKVEFRDSFGSNPPSARAGDEVGVLYLPTQPGEAKVDRGWFNHVPAALLLLAGALLLRYALRSWAAAGRRGSRAWQPG